MSGIFQYDSKTRRRLKTHGTDTKLAFEDLFQFFLHEVDGVTAVRNLIRDPLTQEVHENMSSFRVVNESSGMPMFTIQMEF